ncbi:acyl-CoA dehydrogenase family protein [Mycobacterium sp.]|uniref:acyl-CoA dehydrogenase family protein n=1 Tax=Mycobacterium sp. TaxID=1785 RepID=UPI0025FD9CA8|nr:acyl-CoA dehydrogenase family protein [Mycobacterium sp.]
MDFSFSDEQTMLRRSVSQYLGRSYGFERRQEIIGSERGTSDEVWQQFQEFGLLALPFPEELGGLGGSSTDVVAIAELFGEHLVSEPYLSSVILTGRALALIEHSDAARTWLDMISDGEALGAFAHEEGRGTADPARITTAATLGADGYLLSGEKRLVLGGGDAQVLVVTARLHGAGHAEGELGIVLLTPDVPGVSLTAYRTIDGRKAANCTFDEAPVTLLAADAAEAIAGILEGAILALSAEAVGAMNALVANTVSYAGTRQQFGVPIATFQAVAHRLADMKIALVKVRSTLLYTTALVESARAQARDISLLKAQVGRLGRAVAESAIQIHGGIGMTDEVAVGHHLKRILAVDAMFGDSDYHYRKVGAR